MPDRLFDVCLLGSVVQDALLVGVVLYWPRSADRRAHPRTLGLSRVLAALIAAGVGVMGKAVVVALVTRSVFPLMNLAYVTLGASLPLIGLMILLTLLWRRDGERAVLASRWVRFLAVLLLVPGPVAAYATFVAPYQLRLETPTLHLRDRALGDSITIAVLADIQTDRVGAYEHGAVDRVMAAKPDLVLLPGDLFQNRRSEWEAQTPALRELLAKLSAPGGVFMVPGNVDRLDPLRRIIDGTDVRLLVNEVTTTRAGGVTIHIGGLALDVRSPRARATIEALSGTGGDADIRLLLSHVPDSALLLGEDSRVDLIVAGHTHGGQVVIPGFGPPVTFSRVPREVAAGGLHELFGTHVYVSRGAGIERGLAPRVRFFCPPEITLLTLAPRLR